MSATDNLNSGIAGGDHSADQSGNLQSTGDSVAGGDHSNDQSGNLSSSTTTAGGGNPGIAGVVTDPATDVLPAVSLDSETVKAYSSVDTGMDSGNMNMASGAKAGQEEEEEEEDGEGERKKKKRAGKKNMPEGIPVMSEPTRMAPFRNTLAQYPRTLEFLQQTPAQGWHDSFQSFAAGLRGYGSGKGMSDATLDQAMRMIFEIGEGCRNGNLNLGMATTVLKGLTHEQVLAQKEAEAEIRGRNAQISIKLRRATESDGVPALGSGISRRPQAERGIFSLAEGAR